MRSKQHIPSVICKVLVGLLLTRCVRAQPRRLTITNGCGTEPLWIAHEPVTSDQQNIIIYPGQSYSFATPNGLASTRFWPKMGCDPTGNFCVLGGSGGPGQSCVRGDVDNDYSSCGPPIDTKFEATFGTQGAPCDAHGQGGCDFIDVSLVDGFTLPFKLDAPGCGTRDCAGLSFDQCPNAESLTAAGVTDSLQAINPQGNKVVGCYSPCSKLTQPQWQNTVLGKHDDPRVAPYCCPTPPVSPEQCRVGPISQTSWVQTIHGSCPGVYAYSYDDAEGLMKCNAQTQYRLTFFCPAGSPLGGPTGGPTLRTPEPEVPHTPWQRLCTLGWAIRTALTGQRPADAADQFASSGQCAVYGCGTFSPDRQCQCDSGCDLHGDCCSDHGSVCGAAVPGATAAGAAAPLFTQAFSDDDGITPRQATRESSTHRVSWSIVACGSIALCGLSARSFVSRMRYASYSGTLTRLDVEEDRTHVLSHQRSAPDVGF